jgi:peptide/nickel transport system permease protein
MSPTLLKRLLLRLTAGAGVIWGAATLTFVAVHVTGGDTAVAILGGDNAWASPEVLASVRHDYGLDQPLAVQYVRYIRRLAAGDLGESYRLRIPVTRAIWQQLGPTVVLTASASFTAVVLAIVAALLTAKRARWLQAAVSGAELAVSSVPSFVVGILLLLVFTFRLRWLPASGTGGWRTLLLPTVTLALPISAVLAQVLRQELEAILEQPFILTARARGMRDASVRLTRALRHALIPLTTLTGFLVAGLLGGAVIVEALFARQGVGRLMLDATTNKDVPVVLGITLLAATVYVVVNLAVDILYGLIDPRVRVA